MATTNASVSNATTRSIAPPDPSLTPEELLRRAVALRPRLRAAQAECERQGRLPQEINDELDAAGFYRIVQPRRFGGYEFDVPTFYRVMMEIARGCTETGWVLSLVSGHVMMLAKFDERAQIEAYGTTGEVRCPGSFAPPGRATPVAGGYRVTGAWQNASGCDISTHFMPLAMVEGADKPTPIQVLLDRNQYEIEDDWDVIGMRGTGSKRVVGKDLFVPTHRVTFVAGMNRGAEPFSENPANFDNPMYGALVGPFLVGETAAVAVGAARAGLDHFEDILRTKKMTYPPYTERFNDPFLQRHYGTALRLVTTAEAALIRAGENYMTFAREKRLGIAFDDDREMSLRLISLQCVQMAWEAIDLVFQAAGTSSSARIGHPLGRLLRNVAVLRTHIVLQLDQVAQTAGRIHFGLPR